MATNTERDEKLNLLPAVLPSSGRTQNGYFFVLRSNELWVSVPDSYADLAFKLLSVDALPSSLDAVQLQFMGCHHSSGYCYTSYTVVESKVVL